jgi:hypothetical protein
MNRRRFLQCCVAGAVGAISGCATSNGDGTTPTRNAGGRRQLTQPRQALGDVDLPVPWDELEHRLPHDDIPAIRGERPATSSRSSPRR